MVDAEARRTVTTELDQTLFVEAGAGSGKTSSLVARIVNLVASGVPVGRIAAITFTEAAARELRTRVRDELERRGDSDGDRQLIDAAGLVESAAFTTLHGFALRLLADQLVELKVVDSISRDCVRKTLKKTTCNRGGVSNG
jgi:ATP-dependent helicase/nuclease subunit A